MKRSLLLGFLVVPLLAAGHESVKVNTWCNFHDDPAVERMQQWIGRADSLIPQIPSEEERYLQAEYDALMKIGRGSQDATEITVYNARFNALVQRRFYYAWQLRKDVSQIRKSLGELLNTPTIFDYRNSEATKLSHAIDASADLVSYANSMGDFLKSESARRDGFVTSDQKTRIYTSILAIQSDLRFFMKCKLGKIGVK